VEAPSAAWLTLGAHTTGLPPRTPTPGGASVPGLCTPAEPDKGALGALLEGIDSDWSSLV